MVKLVKMKAAFDLGPVNPDAQAEQRLYRLDPPLLYEKWNRDTGDHDKLAAEYVVVSKLAYPTETFVFVANKRGKVTNFTELHGSATGLLSHDEAIVNAGYEVIVKEAK